MHSKVGTFAKGWLCSTVNRYIYLSKITHQFIIFSVGFFLSVIMRMVLLPRPIYTYNTQHMFLSMLLKVMWTDGVKFFTITLSFFNEVTLCIILLLQLSPAPVAFFFPQGCETQWKTHDHPSCLSLLALTDIIYTPAYWNCGEKGRGKGLGIGLLLQFCVSTLLTGGWRDMMDLGKDTSLSVETCLLQFIQVLLPDWEYVWEKETDRASKKSKSK